MVLKNIFQSVILKGIFTEILDYFSSHQDKLFIINTIPASETQSDPEQAANLTGINNWLLNEWLNSYTYPNVRTFNLAATITSHSDTLNPTVLQQATSTFIPFLNDAYGNWSSSETPQNISLDTLNLKITGATKTSISLSWSESNKDILGFRIERSLNKGASWIFLTSVSDKTLNFTIQGLQCGNEYSYRVVPYNRSGNLTPSNNISGNTANCSEIIPTSTITTPPTSTDAANNPPTAIPLPTETSKPTNTPPTANGAPVNPGNLSSPVQTKSTIDLSWDDQSSNEMGFKIEKSLTGSTWYLLDIVASNIHNYTDSGLTCGQNYYYPS